MLAPFSHFFALMNNIEVSGFAQITYSRRYPNTPTKGFLVSAPLLL